MTESNIEERAGARNDQWRERIAEQERSGLSVRRFCKEQGLAEHSFYAWRKRLRKQGPIRFALVERGPAPREQESALELVLATGAPIDLVSLNHAPVVLAWEVADTGRCL